MKISVIGTGYVGLVSGTCFAEMGNEVWCVDVDAKKIENLKRGVVPIYEPGLEPMVRENFKKGSLKFTTDIKEALDNSEICFIAVGTPMGEDGSADLKHVLSVAREIGANIEKSIIVVNKSTVPVGTADRVREEIEAQLRLRGLKIEFSVVSNPEFLKEGAAVEDFMKPDRVVVGADSEESLKVMRELYAPFTRNHDRFISMDIRSAEMTKYAANAMLATKISFINEMAQICERVGADINKVRIGIGSDSRIGYSFIYPGCGYGGSCFPKDIKALEKIALDAGYEPKILKAVEAVNRAQKMSLVEKTVKRFGDRLDGKLFAIWGLSFKPETDDMREAPSITLINELVNRGAKIRAYDPKALHEAHHYLRDALGSVEFVESKYDALRGADALYLVTEWKEFRSPDFDKVGKLLKNKIIFDGRNQYDAVKLQKMGFEYYQIGVNNYSRFKT